MEGDPAGEEGGAKGKSYRGLMSSTHSGRTCQKWTADFPWDDAAKIAPVADRSEPVDPEDEEAGVMTTWGNGLGNHNYCRNPDQSEDKPWCYTLDSSADHAKETCEVPECPGMARDFHDEATTIATKVASHDCECAAQLYGATTTSRDTSVSMLQRKMGKIVDGKCHCH